MTCKDKKKIINAFFNYKKFMESCVMSTVEWAESNMGVSYDSLSVQSTPSNKREDKLCGIIDKSASRLKWCNVVEQTLARFHLTDRDKLIDNRFFKKKSVDRVCYDLGLSRATFFRWQDEITEYAYLVAEGYGIL